MSHLKWGATTGYGQHIYAASSQTVRSGIVISDFLDRVWDSDAVEHDLCSKIVQELLTNKMIRINQEKNINNDITFTAELTVVQPSIKMMNVSNEVFYINSEQFNEEDIITALKNTFPERFI